MTQFYIVEIQLYATGDYGHLVHFAYDADPGKAALKAESKYYEILSAAAVSELPSHAAILFNADGEFLMSKCYKHETESPAEETESPAEGMTEE